jgi:ABC-type nitrate/sulfonate/bicarbonate transport system substrate-binding protein
VPWYQETYLASSESFLRDHPEAVKSFLAAYLKAVREVTKARGQWTPELLALATKWTGMPEDLLRRVGGIPYWDEKAAIRVESLARVQRFWADSGLVKKPIDPARVVDMTPLEQARQAIGAL